MANKVKTLRVRAVTGTHVSEPRPRGDGSAITYVGRKHDPAGDKSDLEAEFPPCGVVEVKNDHAHREFVKNGSLEAADDASAVACGLKPATKPAPEAPKVSK